jgi:transcriptional regulator with XRE-family HTH domain
MQAYPGTESSALRVAAGANRPSGDTASHNLSLSAEGSGGHAHNNRSPTSADAGVGSRIKELRRASGRTQKEIADIVGVTGAQFHRYETGATRVAASRLMAIAEALNVRPEVLMGTSTAPAGSGGVNLGDAAPDDLLELVEVFAAISDPRRRAALMAFARVVAKSQQGPTEE